MRELKFRVWDKEKSRFTTQFYIGSDGYVYDWSANILIDCEPMQYTGIKDKNGVEVYKNSILKDNDGNIYLCDIGGYFSDDSVGFGVHYLPNGDETVFARPADPFGIERNFEVIGDFNENPELLESAK